ncbi:MAG TPA: universal stress protein [Candidatus Eisenbacteria bacterium]|nr:universal stress protein [Candidatus Eisenbacteria bacterium]
MEKIDNVKKILAPTDLSEASAVGVRYALEMAEPRGAEVIVYHVVEVGEGWNRPREGSVIRDMLDRERRLLDRFLRDRFPELINRVQTRQVVEFGAAQSNIVAKAAGEAVDIIVMSTHGRTGLDHLLIGSVSEKMVARAPCPVLVLPARKVGVARAA